MAFIENNINGVVYMTSQKITSPHGFSTRLGGVSTGILSSLNLGEHRGDSDDNVRENYRRFCAAVGADYDRLVFSKQVHKTDVRDVTSADIHTLCAPVPYETDGLVTAERGLALVIFSADCIPVLLHDPVGQVIGACHCGWRGTVGDMAGETVRTMIKNHGCNPADIYAAIGPGIDKCCFETDEDVPNAVRAALGSDADRFIKSTGTGKFSVDLKGINREFLIRAGVAAENIDVSDECTSCKCEKYWSHRKTKGERGSQAAIIYLK